MIKINNLCVEFTTPIEKKVILSRISLELEKNSLVAIVGDSGSGKSTLLDVLALNNINFSGSYYFKNVNVKTINLNLVKRKIVYLNQGQALFSKLDAYRNTKLINYKISNSIFTAVINKFGLSRIKNKKIEQLSGGEKQRVGIVRSISKNCELLVLDEPTSNLDNANKSYFIEEIEKYKRDRLIIIATHDQDLIKKADTILNVSNGSITITKSSKNKNYVQKETFNVNNNSVVDLIVNDLLTNKKRLFLFVGAMSNGLLGLLMGFVIVSGFEDLFITILVNQVETELSIVYPPSSFERVDLDYKYVYLNNEELVISGEYFNLLDSRIDLFNNSEIDTRLRDNQVILLLDETTYDRYYPVNSIINHNKLIFSFSTSKAELEVVKVLKADSNALHVSKEFQNFIIERLELAEILVRTKVLDISSDEVTNKFDVAKIASAYRLQKFANHIIEIDKGNFLNLYDLDNYSDYLICNSSYEIYCDTNAATAYLDVNINGTDLIVKISNDNNISVSTSVFKNLNSSKLLLKYNNDLIVNSNNFSIFESEEAEIKMPFSILVGYLKNYYGPAIQADYLLVNKEFQSKNVLLNYKIISPYETYLQSFKEILDAVFIGFLIYSLVSLLLGIVTVSILIILELDSRRKHIGTLMLLGWSSFQIKIWIVSNAIIKTIITFAITSLMINVSINTLNVVIKEVSDILIVFNYPPLSVLIILIISLLLIIGNISLFHVNYLLKKTPKKLISDV